MVSGLVRICCKPSIYESDECTLAQNCYNLSLSQDLKILLVNDTPLQTHPKVWVVNFVNPHNVCNKPNDLRNVDPARTVSSVSRTSIFGIIAIWSAHNTFHILTRMSGQANQDVHIYWSSPLFPIGLTIYQQNVLFSSLSSKQYNISSNIKCSICSFFHQDTMFLCNINACLCIFVIFQCLSLQCLSQHICFALSVTTLSICHNYNKHRFWRF